LRTSKNITSGRAKSKDLPLEALRGIAALIVVFNHSVAGFLPQCYGYIPSLSSAKMQGSVLYIFFNGAAAVSLFFVLSGYILTRRFFASGETRSLMKGAVKRWPRLAGPVFVTTLASYLLFYFHLYHFDKAGLKSGSPWLTEFGDSFLSAAGPNLTVQSIHYWNMLQNGLFLTFFRGDALFDSSLWTMHPELVGSFVAFGAAPLLLEARRVSVWATLWLSLMAMVILHFIWADLTAFPIGVAIAALLPRNYALRPVFAVPAILLALYLLGYPGTAVGAYAMFGWLAAHGMPYGYPYSAGAAILIGVIETFPPIRQVFSGKISAFLGDLSFPIYLLHVLVICSIGSAVYLRFGPILAIISVFVISILVSLPMMKFNNWWIAKVNAVTEKSLQPRRSTDARELRSGERPLAPGVQSQPLTEMPKTETM
jgi:peptidoglycan/LPS O-acetylase OafA/YrhL